MRHFVILVFLIRGFSWFILTKIVDFVRRSSAKSTLSTLVEAPALFSYWCFRLFRNVRLSLPWVGFEPFTVFGEFSIKFAISLKEWGSRDRISGDQNRRLKLSLIRRSKLLQNFRRSKLLQNFRRSKRPSWPLGGQVRLG